MSKHFDLIPVIIILSVLLSCSSVGQTEKDERFSNVNATEANALIEKNKDNSMFVILDTRTPAEYDKAHLTNAEFYNYNAQNYWDQIKNLDKNKIYLVYCHSGGRSGKTVKFMKENGFSEAHNLDGGIVAWKRAEYKTVKGS